MRIFDVGAPDGEQAVRDRLLTVPNALTLARFALLPLVWSDLVGGRFVRATVLVGVLGLTDWFDGYLARRLDQISRVGKLLDPIGDRALLAVVGVGAVVSGVLPVWAVVVLLAREVLVATAGLALLARGRTLPETSRAGKASTMGIMIALPLFLLARALEGASGAGAAPGALRAVGWVVLVPNVVLAYAAALGYARAMVGPPVGD